MKAGFFPVGIDSQGVPCKPYRVWVCSVPNFSPQAKVICIYIPASSPKVLDFNERSLYWATVVRAI